MYYTSIPTHIPFTLPISYPNPTLNPALYSILRQALEISLANYAQTLHKQEVELPHKQKELPLPPTKTTSSSTLQTCTKRQPTSKQSEKSSEAESQKMTHPATHLQPHTNLTLEDPLHSTPTKSQDQVILPKFHLCAGQLQAKLQSLLARRVQSWKKDRPKRRASRMAYSWY